MTYLAGLETQTMIWVAPSFREEHLSAIRWLNEHTVEPFAFFALRVRVVQIGNSAFAPLFEVVERPNNWDRQISAAKRENRELSELGQFRSDFWLKFAEVFPDTVPGAASSQWVALPGTDAVLVQYVSRKGVGLFVRADRGSSAEETRESLEPFAFELERSLNVPIGDDKSMFISVHEGDMAEKANWDRACIWLAQNTQSYISAFSKTTGGAIS